MHITKIHGLGEIWKELLPNSDEENETIELIQYDYGYSAHIGSTCYRIGMDCSALVQDLFQIIEIALEMADNKYGALLELIQYDYGYSAHKEFIADWKLYILFIFHYDLLMICMLIN
ncbi:hypothetical protein ACJX0J_007658 [Zea mays]